MLSMPPPVEEVTPETVKAGVPWKVRSVPEALEKVLALTMPPPNNRRTPDSTAMDPVELRAVHTE
jgi:hypothetical protein